MMINIVELGSIAEFRNGINYNKNNFGNGIKVINVADFKDYFKPKYDELGEINPEGIVNDESLLQKNDIIFVRSNGNKELIGRTLFIDKDYEDIIYSAFCIRCRFIDQEVEPKFYAYLFKTNLIRSILTAQGNGTNISNLNQGILDKLQVPKPPKAVQKKIVEFLSIYDDLIENNLKRIKLLEESIELLYKEWFTNFRFPGHERVKLVNGIPDKWKREKVGNYISKFKRKIKIKKYQYLENGNIPIIDQSKNFIGGYTNNDDAKEINIPAIVFGDHTRVVKYINFPFASGADGTQLIYSNSPEISQQYFYCAIKNIDLSNYSYARHFKYLKDEEIYIPSKDIMDKFSGIVGYNFKQITNLSKQNKKLMEARDILIPKLMKGEIEV